MSPGTLRHVVASALATLALGLLAAPALAQDEAAEEPVTEEQAADEQEAEEQAAEEQVADDAQLDEALDQQAAERPVPAGLHLSTYASRMCARVDRAGALDSGAAVLQLVDAETGAPLPIESLGFGAGPTLWIGGQLAIPGLEASVRMLALPIESHGDERLRALVHVELINPGNDVVMVKLAARLAPGGADPLSRPVDALDFVPGTRFAQDGDFITRDGSAILAWVGQDPTVKLEAEPASPDAAACTLTWELPVQPNTARFLDLSLAGPAHAPVADEAGWRETLASWSYANSEEQLAWQTEYRGTYTAFRSGLRQLDRMLSGSVHVLRSLGEANREVVWLTDRPYGFPPSDAAVPAQIMGLLYEWGMAAFAQDHARELVDTATAAGQQLSPARRVALVHGLTSAVRLTDDVALIESLAAAIRALVVAPAAVEPWLDPEIVRADLAEILTRADPVGGAEAAARLPMLSWCEQPDGPVAAQMLAARRALSAGDRLAFWEHYSALLEGTNKNGLGSMRPGGDLDGQFPIAMMYLTRAMLIDDHGQDLHLLRGTNTALLPERDEFDLPWLPTRFGELDLETYHVPGPRLATTVRLRESLDPRLIFIHLPAPLEVRNVVDSVGGLARLMPDGSCAVAIDPNLPTGLNFTVTAVPPGR